MIKPTIGRVVLFTPVHTDTRFNRLSTEPMAAHVAYVWNDRMVNLLVIDHVGCTRSALSVTLLQDDDAKPEAGGFATWMDYQKGQAAKFDAAAGALAKQGLAYDATKDEIKPILTDAELNAADPQRASLIARGLIATKMAD